MRSLFHLVRIVAKVSFADVAAMARDAEVTALILCLVAMIVIQVPCGGVCTVANVALASLRDEHRVTIRKGHAVSCYVVSLTAGEKTLIAVPMAFRRDVGAIALAGTESTGTGRVLKEHAT